MKSRKERLKGRKKFAQGAGKELSWQTMEIDGIAASASLPSGRKRIKLGLKLLLSLLFLVQLSYPLL